MNRVLSGTLTGIAVITLTACNGGSAVTLQQPKTVAPAQAPPVPSPWRVSTSTNELTGAPSVTAMNGYGDRQIIVRMKGKKIDCYLTTGKFLETVDNMHSRQLMVSYKFDQGEIVRQPWTISDDNTALFVPNNIAFLRKMSKAKRFVIEYKPADVIPETASFDVSQFPSEFILNEPSDSRSKTSGCASWQAQYDAGIQDADAANVVLEKLESHHCPGHEI